MRNSFFVGKTSRWLVLLFGMLLFFSCSKNYEVPQGAKPLDEAALIFPDYTDITIPPNIAPLNFMAKAEAEKFVVEVKANGRQVILSGAGEDGVVEFDSTLWRQTLCQNRGKQLDLTLYALRDGQWVSFKPYKIFVAEEEVDPFLSYRLIEPGFEMYRQLGLYQRNLTNFEQNVIYENNREDDEELNHCVNCHNYQNYGGKKMLFHVRANMGGTMIAEDGRIEKINFKCDSTLGSAVYPSWHPTKNFIVFSSNRTGQAFHMANNEKIEVLDYGSDLLFYNADTREVSNILKTDGAMETFPCWSADGKKIYFCQADVPEMAAMADSLKIEFVLSNYREIRYNVMSVSFDEETMSFSAPQLEIDCRQMGKSATVPRISPDGKFLLFTLADFGQFHIWHKSSDQWVKNLETGEIYPLKQANSPDVDTYHSFSSNGRWIVFSSRRDDGSFTRPYFAYFDKQGQARKAFMLPQEDPRQNLMLLKSYNVPELTREPMAYSFEQFREAVYNQNPGIDVKYKELRSKEEIARQRAQNAQDRAQFPISKESAESQMPIKGDASKPDALSGASAQADALSGATRQSR